MRKRPSTLPRRAPAKKTPVRRNTRVAPKKEKAVSARDWSNARIIGVGVVFTLLFLAMGYRAFTLQIIKGPELAEAARKQHITKESVTGVRGNITDRTGNILARSVDSSSVWMDPTAVRDKAETAAVLSPLLGISKERMNVLLQQNRKFIWLARKVDNSVAENVKKAKLRGVYIDHEYDRAYPYKTLAGQLLGFVDVDQKGLEGLEKAFDDRLSGERIQQIVQRDAAGRRMVVRGSTETSDLRGQDVRLTLDANVQFFAEEALSEHVEMYGAKWGGCLVVDVPTGEVLAWAQYPFFDPNGYKKFPPDVRRNRLAMDALEQGSTIKSFLVAAALEEKTVNPDTVINCEKGKWKLGKFTIHDTHPYDSLPVKRILHVSSNIGVAKIGRTLGAEKYHEYLSKLGFGVRTGLPLSGEAKGILRPASRWQDIDLATASFGQSFSATLAQMAQAYLCLANDGKKLPLKLVLDDDAPMVSPDGTFCEVEEGKPAPAQKKTLEGERLFSANTMMELRAMLREVVEEDGGTGKHARIPGMEVGGKTGTAQKADATGKYGKGRVGSFVGMVPIEKPRYLICVLLDEPTKVQYGGVIAAPVFKHVALNTMAYHGLLPDSDDPVVLKVAEKEAQRKNKNKSPKANAAKTQAKPVQVAQAKPDAAVGNSIDTVPSVTGLSLQRAVEVIARHGRVPNIVGSGAVVGAQSPKPGSPWPAGKSCTIWLQESAL